LFGRSVSHISGELEEQGLLMTFLYSGIRIPTEVVRRDILGRGNRTRNEGIPRRLWKGGEASRAETAIGDG
jgi:hypothetical protein